MCKKCHSWFYPTLKVTENKVLLPLYEILSSLQFLDLHFLHGLFQKEIDMYSVSPKRDTSVKNCDKVFVATETWKLTKNFEKKMKWELLLLGQAQPLSQIHAFFGGMATGLYAKTNLISLRPILRDISFNFESDQARKKRGVQNQSACLIGKQLETLLFVLYYRNRICGFHF